MPGKDKQARQTMSHPSKRACSLRWGPRCPGHCPGTIGRGPHFRDAWRGSWSFSQDVPQTPGLHHVMNQAWPHGAGAGWRVSLPPGCDFLQAGDATFWWCPAKWRPDQCSQNDNTGRFENDFREAKSEWCLTWREGWEKPGKLNTQGGIGSGHDRRIPATRAFRAKRRGRAGVQRGPRGAEGREGRSPWWALWEEKGIGNTAVRRTRPLVIANRCLL